MSGRGKAISALTRWLIRHGGIIDKDAAVSVTQAKSGHVITFDWAYDAKRSVRLSFSGVTPDERNEAMIAWLNGEFLPPNAKGGGA